MKAKQLSYAFIGLLVVLGLLTAFCVDRANSLLKKQSATLADLKASSQAADQQIIQLAKDKADIVAYKQLDDIAKSVVPQDKDQAEAVREIVNLASQSGISQLTSIAFPPSTLGIGKAKSTLTQVKPVKGIAGVDDLQITVNQDATAPVSYSSFITFLSKLEQNRRTAQVSSITVQPDQKNASMVSFSLVIDEFIKP